MAKFFGVCGVLFRWRSNSLQVLLVVEEAGDDLTGKRPGMITIPMGHQEEFETPEEAIIREFREEAALGVEIGHPIEDFTEYPTTNGPMQLRAFVVKAKKGEPIHSAHGELKTLWMKVDEFFALSDEKIRPLSKEIVRRALTQH